MMSDKWWYCSRKWNVLVLVVLLAACGSKIDLYTGLSEQDANEVVLALMQVGVQGEKVASKQGVTVRVPEDGLANAVAHLSRVGLPRNSFKRMGDVFKKDSVVSTPVEERSRYLYALSQELESTLSQIDGVILARVHPVLPERLVPGEAAMPSSCSVLIKHRSDWNPSQYEDRIRRLILSSIPGLSRATPSAVSIVFVPSEPMQLQGPATGGASAFAHLSPLQWIALTGLLVVMMCSAIALFIQWSMERRGKRPLSQANDSHAT